VLPAWASPANSAKAGYQGAGEQVLRFVAAGERNVDIAPIIGIGVRTVRGYLDRIRDKTGERRRPGAPKTAVQRGFLGDGGARRSNRV
jgi:two-component system nitrate/nitrite response regulator NarL